MLCSELISVKTGAHVICSGTHNFTSSLLWNHSLHPDNVIRKRLKACCTKV